jgi:hypothetical protein
MSLFHLALGTSVAARRLARLRQEAGQSKRDGLSGDVKRLRPPPGLERSAGGEIDSPDRSSGRRSKAGRVVRAAAT